MYLRDGSWFGKFYEAVTKPLITYVKVVNETRNELIAGLVSDGIREYSKVVLEDFYRYRQQSSLMKTHELSILLLSGITTVMLVIYLILWGVLTLNDHRMITYVTELAGLISRG